MHHIRTRLNHSHRLIGPLAAQALIQISRRKSLPSRRNMRHLVEVIGVDGAEIIDRHLILQAAIAAILRMSFTEDTVEQI